MNVNDDYTVVFTGVFFSRFEQIGNECRQSSTVGNDTETGTTDGTPPAGVMPGQKDGIKNDGDKGTETTKDTIRPHPAASPWGNFTTIVVAIGVLAGIVVAVACVIRRSCSSNQGTLKLLNSVLL